VMCHGGFRGSLVDSLDDCDKQNSGIGSSTISFYLRIVLKRIESKRFCTASAIEHLRQPWVFTF